jgi:hypothetical protein
MLDDEHIAISLLWQHSGSHSPWSRSPSGGLDCSPVQLKAVKYIHEYDLVARDAE